MKKEPGLDEMTLRDLMAMFAMVGVVAGKYLIDNKLPTVEYVADLAYTQAEAMLIERAKNAASYPA